MPQLQLPILPAGVTEINSRIAVHLIRLAVGFYHCERANPAGASSQLQKGLHKLALYLPSCEGIDTARLHRETLAALERIEAGAAPPIFPQIHTHTSSSAGS